MGVQFRMYRDDTYKRAEVLAEIMGSMNKGEYSDFAVRSLAIRAEAIIRDFTKRQVNILELIHICSYVKDFAILPKLQDFEICGISKTLIRKELEKLEELNVISWKRDENFFRIKEPNYWNAPYHSGYNNYRAGEIFELNMRAIRQGMTWD